MTKPVFSDLLRDKAEPLHPDLVPYLCEGVFGPMIKHPLINDIMPVNGMVNRLYAHKMAALKEAQDKQDWSTIIHILVERPFRTEALIDYVLGRDEDGVPFPVTSLTDPDLRDLVAFVWTDSENISEHVDDWLAITEGHVPGQPLLFGDQHAFDALTGPIEVWRGDCEDGGWSWSTKRSVAEFFSRRWDEHNDLLHGYVDKRFVFGYLTNRQEFEVMVRREHVVDLTSEPCPCEDC